MTRIFNRGNDTMKQCLDFNKKFYLPQVKRDLVSSKTNFPYELPNDLRLDCGIEENIVERERESTINETASNLS